jgi:hypothetical protein
MGSMDFHSFETKNSHSFNVLILVLILEIPFCGVKDRFCQQTVVHQNAATNVNEIQSSSCHCLSTCTSISYDAEINNMRYKGEARYLVNLYTVNFI